VSRLKIGYVPNSGNLGHPADRRRIVYWAKKRGHEVTLDLGTNCDVWVLSSRADLTKWSEQDKRPPLILDLVDGYLGNELLWRDWLRGAGKVLNGQISGTIRPFRKIVGEACKLAQAVICETMEQRETILPFCTNTHAILDFHEEFPMLPFRTETQRDNFPSLLWEGLPFTAKGLLQLEKAFSDISNSHRISLEMVTDLSYPLFLGKYFKQKTWNIVQRLPEILGEHFRIVEWNIGAVVEAAQRSHLAVLPLDPSGTLNPLKAENRLLMMWRIGLPTLVSPSLAYNRVMQATGIDGVCHSPEEWEEKILSLMNSVTLREEWVDRGQQYIRDTHSEQHVMSAWDNLIDSVM
jgi:hypothetical protein